MDEARDTFANTDLTQQAGRNSGKRLAKSRCLHGLPLTQKPDPL